MKKSLVTSVVIASICVIGLVTTSLGITNNNSDKEVEFNLANLDVAIENTLKVVPLDIESSFTATNHSVEDALDSNKFLFRYVLEYEIQGLDAPLSELERQAKQRENILKESIVVAEEKYGVQITNEEVDSYIRSAVTPAINDEKIAYAKALGMTLEELDYTFDRDFYVMDVLWDKLFLVLIDANPPEKTEEDEAYFQRLKDTFYEDIDSYES